MSDWKHRAYIIIPVDQTATANALAAQLDPAGGGDKTFGDVQLSPTGQPPATYTGCSTMLTDTGKAAVDQYYGQGVIPGGKVYYAADGWDWPGVLAALGLQVIEQSI